MIKLDQLTIIIITYNQGPNLHQLLPILQQFCPNIILIDSNSTDDTDKIAKQHHVQVYQTKQESFAKKRDFGLGKATTPWVFYLDTDERPSPALIQEIATAIKTTAASALTLRRQNICYGQALYHGGWQNDFVTRLFQRQALSGWTGSIHESPQFQGNSQILTTPLLHFTHQNTAANLAKSARWTIKEAELLAAAASQPVTAWTILRKTSSEFLRRYFFQKGYRDGLVGFIESYAQAVNRGFVYIQVWELQNQPSIPKKYQDQEDKLQQLWQKYNEKEPKRTSH